MRLLLLVCIPTELLVLSPGLFLAADGGDLIGNLLEERTGGLRCITLFLLVEVWRFTTFPRRTALQLVDICKLVRQAPSFLFRGL